MKKSGFFRGVFDGIRSTVGQPSSSSSSLSGAKAFLESETEEVLKPSHFKINTVGWKKFIIIIFSLLYKKMNANIVFFKCQILFFNILFVHCFFIIISYQWIIDDRRTKNEKIWLICLTNEKIFFLSFFLLFTYYVFE